MPTFVPAIIARDKQTLFALTGQQEGPAGGAAKQAPLEPKRRPATGDNKRVHPAGDAGAFVAAVRAKIAKLRAARARNNADPHTEAYVRNDLALLRTTPRLLEHVKRLPPAERAAVCSEVRIGQTLLAHH